MVKFLYKNLSGQIKNREPVFSDSRPIHFDYTLLSARNCLISSMERPSYPCRIIPLSDRNPFPISSFAFRKIADPEYLPEPFFAHAQEILYRNIGRFIQGAAQKTVCIPLIILIDPASVPEQP